MLAAGISDEGARCSLNGEVSGNACVCDDGWTGARCSALKQGESVRVWPPAGTGGQDPAHLSASWGAGLVPPVPGVSEKWHLYVDSVCVGPAPLACSHTHMAQLVHAEADQATGPFVFADVAVLPSANNPAAVYDPVSKLYLLYYLDMCLGGPPDCPPLQATTIGNWSKCTGQLTKNLAIADAGAVAVPPPPPPMLLPALKNACMGAPGQTAPCERIAIASSPSPRGPWTRSFPALSAADKPGGGGRQSIIANPGPFVFPNGSVMLVYRYNPPGGKPAGEVMAVAMSEHGWAGPYVEIADNITNVLPTIPNQPSGSPYNPSAEDPILFQNKRGFHIIYHQYNQSDKVTGGHVFSLDGRNWTTSPEAVYDVQMDYTNGTSKRVDHRERPTLLTDASGTPEWLITGVEVGSKAASFPSCFSETALTKILKTDDGRGYTGRGAGLRLGGVFDVTKHGAVGDGKTYDTAAVRSAAAAATAAGGGTLLFPAPRTYLTGAFNVSSHTHVEIPPGATVLGSTRGEDWPLLDARAVWPQFGHGSDCVPGAESCRLMHQALIFSWGAVNVSMGGGGSWDCNSQKDTWWGCARDLSKPPCSGYGRPHCLMFSNVTDVRVAHLHVSNSPDWTMHFSSVTGLHVHHNNVSNPQEPNADGIDIDSTQDALIEDNYFNVGDDALCVKSGINYFGRRFARPAKNILFRRNIIGTGHGITIGSETSGGVSNVTFEDIVMEDTGTGVRMKSERGRGGVVEDVTYRRIHMKEIAGQCIQVTLNYAKGLKPTNKTATPAFRNIVLEDIKCDKAETSYLLDGLAEQHVENLTLRNVTMGAAVGKEAACDNVECTCDALTIPCPSCCKRT
jgi:hypothetical protein